MTERTLLASALLLLLLLLPLPAQAQASRTWVSGTGDDANPCSRTAPCKTFAGAASRTAAGGTINAFDAGGFGPITLVRAINIITDSATANILAGPTGITINAGASDDIVLSGLTIQGTGGSQVGIRVSGARSVIIRSCIIQGFQEVGISVEGNTSVLVSDCTVADSAAGVRATAGKVFLDRVRIMRNQGSGVRADGNGVSVQINDSAVTYNGGAGLDPANGAELVSFGNNALFGNASDGTPTRTLPLR